MKHLFYIIITAWAMISVNSSCAYGNDIPRPEYPRPQFERTEWLNLNGNWTYTFDFGNSGIENRLQHSEGFGNSITVPFCPESPLSGVGHKDFINAMWYHRTISIPQEWAGKRVLLHFGGVDYRSNIYIDGHEVFEHYGGAASFCVDITDHVKAGKDAHLVVHVRDDVRSREQPGGKQSRRLNSYECFYTRVTGIWSTVWMEPVAEGALKSCRITPDLDNSSFIFEPVFLNSARPGSFEVSVTEGTKTVFRTRTQASNSATVVAKIKNPRTWSPESPFLYGVEYVTRDADGNVIDRVKAYAGMRKVELRDKVFYLNNAPYYQRLVLDQGYYPDGQWTAPTDGQLRRDIELAKEAGFNGARLHQKVFDQRYFYWADRLGYLTWGESPSWEMDWTNRIAARNMIAEWEECVERDYNAPSIVAWSPLNETWMEDVDGQRARLTNDLYFITKRLDRTRPVVSASGGYHAGFTDIYAEHTYEQDPVKLYRLLELHPDGQPYIQWKQSARYKGEAYMIDEFGGIRWVKKMKAEEVAPEGEFWGYGKDPQSLEEYYKRLEEQVNVVLSLDHITGFCYTQIVDVELEKNGIYTYDRERKFDMERIHRIFTKPREQAKKEVEKMLKERENN
ncbi:MAG: glycoside hydrolase family 2 protein [Prevotella sp.]